MQTKTNINFELLTQDKNVLLDDCSHGLLSSKLYCDQPRQHRTWLQSRETSPTLRYATLPRLFFPFLQSHGPYRIHAMLSHEGVRIILIYISKRVVHITMMAFICKLENLQQLAIDRMFLQRKALTIHLRASTHLASAGSFQ